MEGDFSNSKKDISESGEGREISGNAVDGSCATEILNGDEISVHIVGAGGDVSLVTAETGATDLLGDEASPENIPSFSGFDPCNRYPCFPVSAVPTSRTTSCSFSLHPAPGWHPVDGQD